MHSDITIQEFYQKLERHDWYYMMSDDHSVWQRGKEAEKNLKEIASEHGDKWLSLFEDFGKHMFTGRAWGNERQPKPEMPT